MKKPKVRYLCHRAALVLWMQAALIFLLLSLLLAGALRTGRMVWMAPLGALLFGGILYFSYRWLYLPYRESAKVFQLFARGYLIESVFEQRLPLSPEIQQAMEKFKEIIDTKELLSSSKRQAQYLALQNQINPHFLYNTLEGIRGETMKAGLDHVSKMTEALATYFRYTISNVEKLVTLEDELSNIENYYIIQRYRFGSRLNLEVECDPAEEASVMRYYLPKLTLQPIVENAIRHGIERKLGEGMIRIRIETTPKRLLITVSDNGLGMGQEQLDALNGRLNQVALTETGGSGGEGGIAMVNVNSRIRLLFGEDYGICVYSTPGVGTDVVITLPRTEEIVEELHERGSAAAG